MVRRSAAGVDTSRLLAYSFSKPVVFPPGTAYDYSNTNTVLLGLVVEKASHEPLAAYIKRHILGPEHLLHTSFPTGTEFPPPHAQGYTNNTVRCLVSGGRACRRIVNATSWSPSWGWAAAAMISTLGDLHDSNGWIGHNGGVPGYQSLTIYLPSRRATVVVLINTNINPPDARTPVVNRLGRVITRIILREPCTCRGS